MTASSIDPLPEYSISIEFYLWPELTGPRQTPRGERTRVEKEGDGPGDGPGSEAGAASLRAEIRGLAKLSVRPDTGDSCIKLAGKADWKNPDTIRQGCDYQDFLNAPLNPGQDYSTRYNAAECVFVGKCNPAK